MADCGCMVILRELKGTDPIIKTDDGIYVLTGAMEIKYCPIHSPEAVAALKQERDNLRFSFSRLQVQLGLTDPPDDLSDTEFRQYLCEAVAKLQAERDELQKELSNARWAKKFTEESRILGRDRIIQLEAELAAAREKSTNA